MIAILKGLGPEKDYVEEDLQDIKKTGPSSHQRGRLRKTRP
jgi:hypothetical protein